MTHGDGADGADGANGADDADDVEAALRAGLALYADGAFHAAHEPWEAVWLDSDGDTERLLHGLIQLTAALYHTTEGNWAGARGLAESAPTYLAGLEHPYGVDLGAARSFCRRLASDPVVVERTGPPPLPRDGAPVAYADLSPAALDRAVAAVAADTEWDTETLRDAATFADADGTTLRPLLVDFLARPDDRAIVFQRLSEHVGRRRTEVADVRGLFDEE
ncbi:DUF309 domain-containing protein [Halobaculum sp. MBLA0143]|uniref:DUF309 domain-containing protein n=1 Tax=Halobaculum sp. MBLA0143 TaxID=3079933 RepID=UPI0035261655